MAVVQPMSDPTEYLVSKWTFLLFQLTRLLDRGERVDTWELSQHVNDGSLFQWLGAIFPFPQLDLGTYRPGGVYPAAEMIEVLQRIDGSARKFEVSNNGLARLVAYGLQAMQQRE